MIDTLIMERKQKIAECQDMKIEILKERKKPDILVDRTGRMNVDQNEIASIINQLNNFIVIAEAQISVLEELKERSRG